MKMLRILRPMTPLWVVGVLAVSHAGAAVTYTYVGNDFTSVYGNSFTTGDKVNLSFTVPAALPGAGTEQISPTSYTAYDGRDTISGDFSDAVFDIQTSGGQITGWYIYVATTYSNLGGNVGSSAFITTSTGLDNTTYKDQSYYFSCPNENCEEQFTGQNFSDGGSWSEAVSGTPEPGAWVSVICGATMVGSILRRSRRRPPSQLADPPPAD